jgi:hypothetical protein
VELIRFGGAEDKRPVRTGPRNLDTLSVFHFMIELRAWIATVWCHENQPPLEASELATFDQLRLIPEFRARYADDWAKADRPLSLEEIWVMQQLAFRSPVMCLVSEPFAEQATEQIRHRRVLRPVVLLRLLHMHYCVSRVATRFTCLEYDGVVGHCITLDGVDAQVDAFRFYDSWGKRSLLCRENNHAGVDALADPRVPNAWLIDASQLMKVVVAVLVPWPFWAFWQEVEQGDDGYTLGTSMRLSWLRQQWVAANGGVAGALAVADTAGAIIASGRYPPDTAAKLMAHPDPELQYALDVCDTAAAEEDEPGRITARSECVFADILADRGMPDEAARWYRRAAEHGDVIAQARSQQTRAEFHVGQEGS